MEGEHSRAEDDMQSFNDPLKADWQMETVPLEFDSEPLTGENKQICDSVVYEQEAELHNQAHSVPVVRSFFTETSSSIFDEIDSSATTNTVAEVKLNLDIVVDNSLLKPNNSAAMLTSYYDEATVNQDTLVSTSADLAVPKLECVTVPILDESPVLTELPGLENLIIDNNLEVKVDSNLSKPAIRDEVTSDKLSKLFAEDKFGSDKEGKAFFDVFSQGISIADADQMSGTESFTTIYLKAEEYYDVWIPKQSTKQVLKALQLNPSTPFQNNDMLTMPGVIITEDLKDPVRDLARQYLGEESANQRVILTADSVSQDEEGLLKLVSLGYYRAAVNLTTRLLTSFGQGLNKTGCPSSHTPLSLQLWLVRLTLLTKLRLFNMAEAEGEPFGDLDQPDLYYEFYPDLYGGRKGTMVPFALRVLLPQINTCVGKYGEALDRLYSILHVVLKIMENLEQGLSEDGSVAEFSDTRKQESLTLWKKREEKVLYTIVNCLVAQTDFQSAYSLLDTILVKTPADIANVRSAQGHILLQLGDVKGAKLLFGSAASARGTQPSDTVANLIEKAALAIASNNFLDGYCVLKEAQTIDSHNPVVLNNMAVCLLYMGKLRAACQLLENSINSNPKLYLHECVLVNICTLYDLESSRSLQKKSNILDIVNRHSGDGFNSFCLKLPAPT